MLPPVNDDIVFNDKKLSLFQAIDQLRKHPIFFALTSADRVKLYMSMHAYSVWGYISLLKRLQLVLRGGLTSWAPTVYPRLLRAVNELVLAEETTLCVDGVVRSHFEMYNTGLEELCSAMQAKGLAGASIDGRQGLSAFNRYIRIGLPAHDAAAKAGVQPGIVNYIKGTVEIGNTAICDELLATLVFGYTDPVHSTLEKSILSLGFDLEIDLPILSEYLDIHTSNADDENKKLSDLLDLVFETTGQSAGVQSQIFDYGIKAINARSAFWDEVLHSIKT